MGKGGRARMGYSTTQHVGSPTMIETKLQGARTHENPARNVQGAGTRNTAGVRGGREVWVQKEPGQGRADSGGIWGSLGLAAEQYLQHGSDPALHSDTWPQQTQLNTVLVQTGGIRKGEGQEQWTQKPDSLETLQKTGEGTQQHTKLPYNDRQIQTGQAAGQLQQKQINTQNSDMTQHSEYTDKNNQSGQVAGQVMQKTENTQNGCTAPHRDSAEGNAQTTDQIGIQLETADTFRDRFRPEPVDVESLSSTTSPWRNRDNGGRGGYPTAALVGEQEAGRSRRLARYGPLTEGLESKVLDKKLFTVADWLKVRYGLLTEGFWDSTYVFSPRDILKRAVEQGLQAGVRWTEVWQKLMVIV
ncbi:hypothetical protein CBR_g24058 [Chara braunii]|uniref:Uncharacterized protein n=1 Tax=Chara braunii TaxID=69332 RepID=A0A388L5U4_CHABU|nr:hypothetical protein CBR_g24058 [Chara braunii]|eukprot:GBG77612.1 hypothetical protein CBR_g24058 [Chara braunii]